MYEWAGVFSPVCNEPNSKTSKLHLLRDGSASDTILHQWNVGFVGVTSPGNNNSAGYGYTLQQTAPIPFIYMEPVIAEYDNGTAPTAPSREYIYSGGALLAKIESGATIYYHPDHLSNRVLTDSSGNSLGQRGHYPFGETWYESGTITKLQFTTYERDSESTNDYAMARTYINRFGRFPSSDPFAGSTGDPQSLNRYTYGRNLPVSLIDPSGMTSSGCLYLKNLDAPSSSESAEGPSAFSDEDADSSPPEPQACPPGGSGGGGFPLGGGNIFDLLAFAFAQTGEVENPACPNGDCALGVPRTLPIYGNTGILGLLFGLPGGDSLQTI